MYTDISRIAAAMYNFQDRFASRREVVAESSREGDTVESVSLFCAFRPGLLAAKGRGSVLLAFAKE